MNKKGQLFGLSLTGMIIIIISIVVAIIFFGLYIRQIIGIALLVAAGYKFITDKGKFTKKEKTQFWILVGTGLFLTINPFGLFKFLSVVV